MLAPTPDAALHGLAAAAAAATAAGARVLLMAVAPDVGGIGYMSPALRTFCDGHALASLMDTLDGVKGGGAKRAVDGGAVPSAKRFSMHDLNNPCAKLIRPLDRPDHYYELVGPHARAIVHAAHPLLADSLRAAPAPTPAGGRANWEVLRGRCLVPIADVYV